MNTSSSLPAIATLQSEKASRGGVVLRELLAGATLTDAAGYAGLSPDLAAHCAYEAASAAVSDLRRFCDPEADSPQPMPRRVRPATWPASLSADQA